MPEPLKIRRSKFVRAFSLPEVIIAMACATFILAALIAGEVTLLRTFDASDRYSFSEMAAERVVDFLGTDLRGAVSVSGTTGVKSMVQLEAPSTGARTPFTSGSLTLVLGGTNLLVTHCDYYASNLSNNAGYRTAVPLISPDTNGVSYGTATGGSNAMILVRYKLAYDSTYGSNCIVREEAPVTTGSAAYTSRVIADKVDNMMVSVALTGTSNAPRQHLIFTTTAWFVPTYSQRSAVTAAAYLSVGVVGRIIAVDTVMTRNLQ